MRQCRDIKIELRDFSGKSRELPFWRLKEEKTKGAESNGERDKQIMGVSNKCILVLSERSKMPHLRPTQNILDWWLAFTAKKTEENI